MTRFLPLATALAVSLTAPAFAHASPPQFGWHTPEIEIDNSGLIHDLLVPAPNPMIVRQDWDDILFFPNSPRNPEPDLQTAPLHGNWILRHARDFRGDRVTLPYRTAAAHPVTISASGQISSYFGCNYGTGRIDVAGDGTVQSAGIGMTLMACFSDLTFATPTAGSDAEEAVAHAFHTAQRVEVTATTLVLYDALFREAARFVRQ